MVQVVKEKLEVPLFKQNFQKWEEEEFKSTFETAKEATGRKETPEVIMPIQMQLRTDLDL